MPRLIQRKNLPSSHKNKSHDSPRKNPPLPPPPVAAGPSTSRNNIFQNDRKSRSSKRRRSKKTRQKATHHKSPKIKIQISSDLHLDSLPTSYSTTLPTADPSAKYLLLAGDTGSVGQQNHHKRFREWLEAICGRYEKVFLVPGNNEFRGGPYQQGSDVLKTWARDERFKGKLKVLQRGRYDFKRGKDGIGVEEEDKEKAEVTILGCTLWSDLETGYVQGEEVEGRQEIEEESGITENTVGGHLMRYKGDRKWLERQINKIRERPGGSRRRIVVATHYAPSIHGTASDAMKGGRKGKAFQNDIVGGETMPGLGSGDYWVFGHTHWNCMFVMDDVVVVANQKPGVRRKGQDRDDVGRAWKPDMCIKV